LHKPAVFGLRDMLTRILRGLRRKLPLIVGGAPRLWADRLVLRGFEPSRDFARFAEYRADPEVLRYLAGSMAQEDCRSVIRTFRLAALNERRQLALAIERVADRALVGEITLTAPAVDPSIGFLGFILHRDCWSHGYATEASLCLLDYAFRDLGYATVFAGCTLENVASRRVLEKLRFSPCAPRDDMPGVPEGVTPLFFSARSDLWLASAERAKS
jgi:[ribosomal protein S5]-alanine N-acetyltransferase